MMPGKRALVVDDSRSARVVLSRMLERYGILVDSAESAEALFKLGVDGYVTKPFELPALLERIQQVRDVRRLSVKTLTVKPRHVLVSERDPLFRESLRVALTSLGCALYAPASLLEGLRATPAPDAVVAEVPQIDTPVRRELFLLRARRPTLRIAVVGEANSLEDTLTAIGVAAHQRISRRLDSPGLLAVLSALLR